MISAISYKAPYWQSWDTEDIDNTIICRDEEGQYVKNCRLMIKSKSKMGDNWPFLCLKSTPGRGISSTFLELSSGTSVLATLWRTYQGCRGATTWVQVLATTLATYHMHSRNALSSLFAFERCIEKASEICVEPKLHHEENESTLSEDNKRFALTMHCCNEIQCCSSHILSQFRNLTC